MPGCIDAIENHLFYEMVKEGVYSCKGERPASLLSCRNGSLSFQQQGKSVTLHLNPRCTIYKKISLSINKGKFDLEKRLHMSQYRSLSSVAQRSPESELSSQEFCFP